MAPLGDPSQYAESDNSFEFDKESCMARDEAAKLRNDLCILQVRLEEVENERSYTAAKANELEEVIQAFKKEYVHEELVKKALQLAEISMTLDSLRNEIKRLKDDKEQLLRLRQQNEQKMEALSVIFRSLETTHGDEYADDKDGVVLTPEKALDLALNSMKSNIEFLEDEHQSLCMKCTDQAKKITQLEKENEMKDVKIGMLEELFRALNETRKEEEVKLDTPTSSSSSSPPPSEQTVSLTQKTSRRNRPAMRKSGSWAGLVESGKRLESTSRKEGMINRRSASLRGLNNETASSTRSPTRRKVTMLIVGDLAGEYAGPIVGGMPHGVGTVRFTNGDTYLGEVRAGKLSGKGTMYTKAGISRGFFEDNIFVG